MSFWVGVFCILYSDNSIRYHYNLLLVQVVHIELQHSLIIRMKLTLCLVVLYAYLTLSAASIVPDKTDSENGLCFYKLATVHVIITICCSYKHFILDYKLIIRMKLTVCLIAVCSYLALSAASVIPDKKDSENGLCFWIIK